MILSRKHRYLFLHCRKAAGTSLKVALSRHFGPRDICLGAWQEIMQVRRFPNRQFVFDALNLTGSRRLVRDLVTTGHSEYFWHLNKQAYRKRLGVASSHPSAARIKATFPQEWDSHFKFAIVRNPFAVAVSSWRQRHSRRGDDYLSFEDYMRAWSESETPQYRDLPMRNWEVVAVDDKVELDLVLRFESLEEDIRTLEQRLGLEIDMPQVNAAARQAAYRDYYDRDTRTLAERMFARELDTFGYAF
ncbi:MAG: sulfotransferase family 2 domain-containing protein [Pseudomonadota bacterium]|nr:sulfotransferase family 2 domain-containing protein [Pseudomonadota bacterium]